ncbi:unnamed protein product [Effrenium voratum]|nr:unnamed protein product [Effrenium voratum]
MGVRGLLSYVLRRDPSKADLVQEAQQKPRQGVTLLVDLLDFCAWFLPEADRTAKGWEPDSTLQVYGSEFLHHDEALCEAIFALRHAGIYLEFFLDPPKGLGLVDVGSPPTQEEAKRCGHSLDAAKVRHRCVSRYASGAAESVGICPTSERPSRFGSDKLWDSVDSDMILHGE